MSSFFTFSTRGRGHSSAPDGFPAPTVPRGQRLCEMRADSCSWIRSPRMLSPCHGDRALQRLPCGLPPCPPWAVPVRARAPAELLQPPCSLQLSGAGSASASASLQVSPPPRRLSDQFVQNTPLESPFFQSTYNSLLYLVCVCFCEKIQFSPGRFGSVFRASAH
uniref:Uncharacterized protein n=1 Tax=Molossus molossus TaxID=27622 RepID=A0A7J8DQ65_MOLMO|nr:hypothetical protein HJG59_009301 [Molossus molossus]